MRKELLKKLVDLGYDLSNIEIDIGKRWENGISHHPNSMKMIKFMDILNDINNSAADLSYGGDGDAGETLLFLMDVYFEAEEKNRYPRYPRGWGYNV